MQGRITTSAINKAAAVEGSAAFIATCPKMANSAQPGAYYLHYSYRSRPLPNTGQFSRVPRQRRRLLLGAQGAGRSF